MLLKAGVAMILFSLALGAVTVTAVAFRADSPEAPAFSAEPRAAEITKTEEREFNPGEKLEIDDEEPAKEPRLAARKSQPESSPVETPFDEAPPSAEPRAGRPQPDEASQTEEESQADEEPRRAGGGSLSGAPPPAPEVPDWPRPTNDQVASAEGPRYYEPTLDTDMFLTIEALGLYDVPAISSYSYETLDRGLMHEPDTSFPWDGGAQRNVYLAGHYLGWPGTASHLVFYNLDKLRSGDEILLEDSAGNDYRYRVDESFMATPDESWVMGQVRNRDMLTLQTCIPPAFEDRLVVRADRV